MGPVQTLFLQTVAGALAGEQLILPPETEPQLLCDLFEMAQAHHVLPLVYETVHASPSMSRLDPQKAAHYRMEVLRSVSLQSQKTAHFLTLDQQLRDRGIQTLVVKGIVCRQLYPLPDHRLSADEDILCRADQRELCRNTLAELGLVSDQGDPDAYEVTYRREDGVHLELHSSLFPPESHIFGDWNQPFAQVFDRCITVTIDGHTVETLNPTDHLLYLLLHAFKHFLHSGFGIRQVCDISLFANSYGSQIDWAYILETCKKYRADEFAAAIFAIAQQYLHFSPDAACYHNHGSVDPLPLLEDILGAGIYGSSDRSRIHSSNLTLNAVSADKSGKKKNPIKTLFPGAKSLENRYPYLKTKPFLLPVAWTSRLVHYAKESGNADTAADALHIGNRRIQLLRHYHIID